MELPPWRHPLSLRKAHPFLRSYGWGLAQPRAATAGRDKPAQDRCRPVPQAGLTLPGLDPQTARTLARYGITRVGEDRHGPGPRHSSLWIICPLAADLSGTC
ncbi:hypothetical protein GCM10010221_47550 [Streptomyces parvus]|nr:hypothetical protein GCM10010221_47550 [Streptomyces parvus]